MNIIHRNNRLLYQKLDSLCVFLCILFHSKLCLLSERAFLMRKCFFSYTEHVLLLFIWCSFLLYNVQQINLIAPPRYVMTTTTLERTEGLSVLNQAMAVIKEKIEEKRGVFNVQMEVRTLCILKHN